ncbi:hypothetical protein NPIL_328951 [Nephila pilipes]|uniref:Uncharacterized protein n=1 Tax=Nephila pilipes TaxID=299642 RepID=A0A8X6MS05_NEPPI|nr:hypothetical protein NPIL_328951 [Nephila pilipes]
MVNAIQTRSQRKKEARQNNMSVANEDNQIEIAENIAEDLENVLLSFREEKYTVNLIKINANEFIEVQKKSEESAHFFQKKENISTTKRRQLPPEGRKNSKVDRKKSVMELTVGEYHFTKTEKIYYNHKEKQKPVTFDPGGVNGFQPKKYLFYYEEKEMIL